MVTFKALWRVENAYDIPMARRKNNKQPKEQERRAEFPQESGRFTVAIIGGGASGIAAACAIGRASRIEHEDVRVVIIERSKRIGSSILRSGNGRCNFSNANLSTTEFNRPVFVDHAFVSLEMLFDGIQLDGAYGSFSDSDAPNPVLRWFKSLGLVWTESAQNAGALYPFSNKANSVLEVLVSELDRCGVERYCGVEVVRISSRAERFSLRLQDAFAEEPIDPNDEPTELLVDNVIYAAGGALRALSHEDMLMPKGVLGKLEWVPSIPVLGPLETETALIEGLDGVRIKARLSCPEKAFYEEGEVLFRSYGISGIVVFNASRIVEPGDTVFLDLAPEWSFAQVEDLLFERSRLQSGRTETPQTYGDLLQGFFLPEVAEALVRACGDDILDPSRGLRSPVGAGGITQLAARIKSFPLRVTGYGEIDRSQVSRGGIFVDSIDPETMQATAVEGLYVTGEAIDVDGPCGGYNLHWAWSSGLLAGLAIVRERMIARMVYSDSFFRSGA